MGYQREELNIKDFASSLAKGLGCFGLYTGYLYVGYKYDLVIIYVDSK